MALSPHPSAADPGPQAARAWAEDVRTIALVGLAHGSSHFFHLLLPPLFPVFIREFGLSYTELGLMVTLFFVVSGLGQALSGFLVDRFGARPVLFFAFGSFIAAALTAALAPSGAWLAVAALLAGLGNAPFHPADFTILNHRLSPARLGHGYAVHGIAGNLGWASAPVLLLGAAAAFGHWRAAYGLAAAIALAVLILLVWQRRALDDRVGPRAAVPAASEADAPPLAPAAERPLAFLRLPAVWLCFAFFFWGTAALAAIQGFAAPALLALHGLPTAQGAYVVSGFMLCGALGMGVGGFLVARGVALERTISLAIGAAALVLAGVSLGWGSGPAAALAVSAAGFGVGLAGPSRDMMIKRAAPPGATGRVYGTVYSGLDIGFAVGAPSFGALLDAGHAGGVFLGSAAAMAMAIVSAQVIRRVGRPAAG